MSNNVTPLVSICSITYNHKAYIRQCLDSLLSQKTDFTYEIIINDDCSTDGTTEIIKEYASKYPNLIHPIFHDENQYSKGVRGMFAKYCFPKARGKYIALCEGDDYWTDPLKLQKQVDFMNYNECCSLCFHHVEVLYDGVPYGGDCFSYVKPGACTLEYMLRNWVIPTCSVLYRREIHEYIPINSKFQYGDNVLFLTCFSHGLVYCVDGVMGVYRRNSGGWTMNKSTIEMMSSQYLHFNGLIESFPGLDLSILVSRVINTATYLLVNERRNISFQVRQQILDNFKSYPIRFLFHLGRKVLRAFLNRLQK